MIIMVTLNQRFYNIFVNNKQKKNLVLSCPQQKAICLFISTIKPKKPNSANRAVAKVLLCHTNNIIWASIPGVGHRLQKHSLVLVKGGHSKDLPNVRYQLVRGTLDLLGVLNRKTRRSKYGTKRT